MRYSSADCDYDDGAWGVSALSPAAAAADARCSYRSDCRIVRCSDSSPFHYHWTTPSSPGTGVRDIVVVAAAAADDEVQMRWMHEKQLSSQVRIDVRRECSFLSRFPGSVLGCDCFAAAAAAAVVVVPAAEWRGAHAACCSSARADGEYGESGLLSCCASGCWDRVWQSVRQTCGRSGRPLSS